MALEFSQSASTDVRSRIDDYLNDKIQTQTDLETLDNLLADVRERQGLLKNQVGPTIP